MAYPTSTTRRGRKMTDKCNSLMATTKPSFVRYVSENEIYIDGKRVKNVRIRRLTPTECKRLQTVPDSYEFKCTDQKTGSVVDISDSQQYRMLGNGWCVEVIKHIFSFLPEDVKNGTRKLRVLSLFDGMSCGHIALRELGIEPEVYYASEIDKHAIASTMHNFPETVQLGNVMDVDARKLGHIDMLIGGSPCTNFSFAGRRNGMNTTTNEEIYTLDQYLDLKGKGFQFDGESFLFWEYMRILGEIRETNPDAFFFLENVEMGKKWEDCLTRAIGIPGVHINAALVSAQTRKRIYWTNIRTSEYGLIGTVLPDIPQPEDRGILLKDVLEDKVDDKYYLKNEVVQRLLKGEGGCEE